MTDAIARPNRRHFLAFAGAAALCPGPGRAAGAEGIAGTAFGTTWSLSAPSGDAPERLRPAIEALFRGIDREMSPWRPDSALSRFNAAGAGRFPAGRELVHVTRAALALSDASGGAFDPTVGPLVARWGFGPVRGGEVPDWHGLDAGRESVAKTEDDLTLDLCGIAKGRALDRALDLAFASGLADALIDLGGELRALGRHPSGRDWQVGIDNPAGEGLWGAIRLPDGQAVATSGLSAQSYVLNGTAWGHIIDPATREPAHTALRSVSVVAGDAMTADGWATALFAAGVDAGPALAEANGLSALFLVGADAGLRSVATGSIGELLL